MSPLISLSLPDTALASKRLNRVCTVIKEPRVGRFNVRERRRAARSPCIYCAFEIVFPRCVGGTLVGVCCVCVCVCVCGCMGRTHSIHSMPEFAPCMIQFGLITCANWLCWHLDLIEIITASNVSLPLQICFVNGKRKQI